MVGSRITSSSNPTQVLSMTINRSPNFNRKAIIVLPKAIRDKLRNHKPLRLVDRPSPVCAGDVRRAESGGEERLVVILKVQEDRRNAQITLVHPYTEYTTSADVVVGPSVSNVPFPLVVQAGIRGVVWLSELGPLVARVPAEVVDMCLSSEPLDPDLAGIWVGPNEVAGLWIGPPMTGPLDARFAFKESEYKSLTRLTADCTAFALSEIGD